MYANMCLLLTLCPTLFVCSIFGQLVAAEHVRLGSTQADRRGGAELANIGNGKHHTRPMGSLECPTASATTAIITTQPTSHTNIRIIRIRIGVIVIANTAHVKRQTLPTLLTHTNLLGVVCGGTAVFLL